MRSNDKTKKHFPELKYGSGLKQENWYIQTIKDNKLRVIIAERNVIETIWLTLIIHSNVDVEGRIFEQNKIDW